MEYMFYYGLIFLLLIVYVVVFGIAISDYIIRSLALYRIAVKRGVANPWLAWIPYGNDWILGSVVDDFESHKGSKRKFRVILLVLALVATVVYAISMLALIVYSVAVGAGYVAGPYDGSGLVVLVIYAIVIPMAVLLTIYQALAYLCLYKTYEYIYPEKSVKYFVLSLIVPLAHSICLLKNAKRCEVKPAVEDVSMEN